MKIKLTASLPLLFAASLAVTPVYAKRKVVKKQVATQLYRRADASINDRVSDLMSRMTLDEKIMQLNQYIIGLNTNGNNFGYTIEKVPGSIGSVINFSEDIRERNLLQRDAMATRLGIPVLFGYDVIHGYRTIYPIPLATACSWNPQLVEQASHVAASETRASGTEWVFAPMVDVTHDARWGRIAEGYGEDPYLASVMGSAAVNGFQGTDLSSNDRVAACLKHYVGYGCSEGGRDYTSTDISDQAMWDTYLPPFHAAVEAGAWTAMSSFNAINGVPSTANKHYLKDVLKQKFGLKGFVVSDWNAVRQLVAQGYAENQKEAAELAINAGLDMDMIDNIYKENLADLIREGRVSMDAVDDALRRILTVKFELGLFENPYTKEVPEKERILKPEYKAVAEKIAEESMVLLKNEGDVLPLAKSRRLALIGPMVKDRHEILGSWRCFGKDQDVQTLYEGMMDEFGKENIVYAKGCDFDGDDRSGFDEAIRVARSADVIVVMLGEKAAWSGENASRSTLALPVIQEELLRTVAATGKPVVLVISAGRPTELCRVEPLCNSILEIWQPGVCGGTPMAGILSGRINPSGRLAVTFPRSTNQIPVYYNSRPSSRPLEGHYQDISITPQYEFGHGLSYTTYQYGDIKAERLVMNRDETLRLTIDVTNTGNMDGMETVQWFVNDPVSRITRPVKELRHFEKRMIRKGETETFTFDINADKHLSFVDAQGNKFMDDGAYYIMVKDRKIELILK